MKNGFPLFAVCSFFLLGGCFADRHAQVQRAGIQPDTLTWFDTARHRAIPVAFYRPLPGKKEGSRRIVIFSHGYGQNKGGDYLAYSYLTENLAAHGFLVVSIQHELPTDSLMPATGVPQVVRRPFWDRGADNILYCIRRLQREEPGLDFTHLALIGHSNGADMTALFAQQYPGLADRIITLDNRRMALPRTSRPRIFSLRSADQPADAGVLPTSADQQRYGITIVPLPGIKHNDMDDHATPAQRRQINQLLLRFLQQ